MILASRTGARPAGRIGRPGQYARAVLVSAPVRVPWRAHSALQGRAGPSTGLRARASALAGAQRPPRPCWAVYWAARPCECLGGRTAPSKAVLGRLLGCAPVRVPWRAHSALQGRAGPSTGLRARASALAGAQRPPRPCWAVYWAARPCECLGGRTAPSKAVLGRLLGCAPVRVPWRAHSALLGRAAILYTLMISMALSILYTQYTYPRGRAWGRGRGHGGGAAARSRAALISPDPARLIAVDRRLQKFAKS